MSMLVAGTRGSDLALWQTRHVAAQLEQTSRAANDALQTKLEIITTKGDVDMADRLVGKLEKGFFTAELEDALRERRIDFAVHSLKDLPTRMPEGLELGAVLPRANLNDLLLVRPQSHAVAPFPVKVGGTVGASSLRRDALLRRFAPHVAPVPLRGNVPTRVQRLREGKCDAILLAAAGLERLGLDLKGLHVYRLEPRRWPTAPGQGAIAVQIRAGDELMRERCRRIAHPVTFEATAWERAFLRVLEGGCATPFGASVLGDTLYLGQAIDTGWRARRLTLPQAPDDAAKEAFAREVLPTLFEKDEDDDELALLQPV